MGNCTSADVSEEHTRPNSISTSKRNETSAKRRERIIKEALAQKDTYKLGEDSHKRISEDDVFIEFLEKRRLSSHKKYQYKMKFSREQRERKKSMQECVKDAHSELEDLGEIHLIDFNLFKKLDEIPRYGSGDCKEYPDAPKTSHNTVNLEDIDRENAFIVFISHGWIAGFDGKDKDNGNVIDQFIVDNWRKYPHPDTIQNHKFELINEAVTYIWKDFAPGMQRCYIWLDFSCIDQNKDPAGELKQLDKIVEACDCILTPVVDLEHEKWDYPSTWADHFTEYRASGFSLDGDEKFSIMNRPWCRVEMLYAANIPLLKDNADRIEHFAHGLKNAHNNEVRPHRPHYLYGSKESANRYDPLQLPPLANSHLERLSIDEVLNNLTKIEDAYKLVELIIELGPYLQKVEAGYIGERNAAGNRHGKGVYTYPNGDKYDGEYENDKKHGKGVYTGASCYKYDGEYKDGQMHGKGVFTFANGDKYDGAYEKGKKHGKGVLTSADGDKYDGEWLDDKMHGKGVFTWNGGYKYDGEWKDGKEHGKGVYTWADGGKYDGEWVEGKKHGKGVMTLYDGRSYQNEWKHDDRVGAERWIEI